MFSEINFFLSNCLKKKQISLIDIYFSKIFEFYNFDSDIIMLFTMLVSLSSRLGNICLPLNNIWDKHIFSNYILDFLYYFFSRYISLNKCIEILFKYRIISKYYFLDKTPLILYNNCIYLYKFWVYEDYVTNYINKNFLEKNSLCFSKKKLFQYLGKFNLDVYQKLSIIGSIINKISIISGGPGTGKTNLISILILVLYKIYKFKNNKCIKIITFTGKSASNITYFLRKKFVFLNKNNVFKNILPKKAITIHKFLGFNYKKNVINKNENNITNIDILIIDESSMIDISLMFYLFSCLKYVKKIIFLGDSNQIGPIESSSLFNEICKFSNNSFFFSKKKLYKNILNNILNLNIKYINYLLSFKNIFFLKKNYRFNKNSCIYKLTNLVNLGFLKKIDKFLYKNNFKKNFSFYDSNKYDFYFLLNFCIKKYMKYINFINFNFSLNKIWKIFNDFQIITIVKKTYFGINFLNKYINDFFLKKNLVKNILYFSNLNCYHYMGEPILINKNNHDLKLFNGDIGFFVFLENEFKLLFLNFNNDIRFINYKSLTNWDNNWVITVHKSQGSEFKHILLVLPDYNSNLLNREIIYTALTRAKKKITIYGNKNIFLNSIKKRNITYNNIVNKLLI